MAPFLIALAKAGLPLLASAIMSEGKEVIEEKLGVDITKLLGSEEGKLKLKELELKHEEFLVTAAQKAAELALEAEKVAQSNVTERWRSDMSSDSWLSKNIRPIVLAYWTLAITGLIVLDSLGTRFQIKSAWISLIEASYMAILAAYFIGRTVQHVVNMRNPK
jgi:hypothetical protein